jgi:hypothetical protein
MKDQIELLQELIVQYERDLLRIFLPIFPGKDD